MVRWASAGPADAHTGTPGAEGQGADEVMPESAAWGVHRALADGWAQLWDPGANAYYYRHEATGAVQWEAPTNESLIHWEYSVDNSEAGEVPQLPAAAISNDHSQADFEPSLVSSLTHHREPSSVITSAGGTVPTPEEVAAAASITSPAGSLAQPGMPGGTDAEWDVMFDGESGQAYFTHRSKGTTTWEVPADMSSTQIDGQVASYLSEDSSSQSVEGSAFAPNPSPPDNMVDTSTPLEGTGTGQDGIGLVISPAGAASARSGGLEGESMPTPLGKSGRRGRSRNASRNLPSDELAAEEENGGGTALVFAAPDASPAPDPQDEAATPPAQPYPEEGQEAGGEWQPPPPAMGEEGEAVNEWQLIEVQRRRSSTQGLSPSQVLAALGWQELYDPGTGTVYYFHPDTGETRWSNPLEEEDPAAGKGPEQEGQPGQGEEAEDRQQEASGEVAMMQWAPQPTQDAQEQQAWAPEAQAGAQDYATSAEDAGAAQWGGPPLEMRPSMDSSDLAVSAGGEGAGEWQEHVDVGTGQLYYYNNVTTESRWDPPPELQLALAQEGGTQPVGEAWQEMYDPVTGQLYFYNEETQESRWALAGPTGEGLDATGQVGGGYENMLNPYDVGGQADNTGALMVTDYGLLETLHRQAGGELEELQRAVHAQNSLVQALERSVYGLHPVAMAAGSQAEAQQDMMQQQADIIKNLESVVGNVQELARGLLTRKPAGGEGEEGGAGSGVEGPNRSVVVKASAKKEQADDEEPEGLEGLLNFAFDEEDEEMRKRVEAAKKQEEEEGPEEEGQGPRKRSDKLLRTVPTRLIRAWRQRKSRKVQEIAKGTAAVTRFSIRNLAKAKGRFKEMLVELKERDRFMDLKFAEPDSDSESEYEEVDLEDLFPHSIVLGQRGQFLELLEPRKAFIYYQNLNTGKFQKQVPSFDQEEEARKPLKPVQREGTGKAPKPAPLIGHSDAGQEEERARSQRTLFTEQHWAERLKVMRKRRGRKGEGRRGASVFQIPALQVLSDPRLTKLYQRKQGGGSEHGEASVATTGSTTTRSLGKPTSLRRPKPTAPTQETNSHSNQGASDKRLSLGTTLSQGLSATMPFLIPPGTLRTTRKTDEGEASGEAEEEEEGEAEGEEDDKDKDVDKGKEPKPAAPRFVNGGPVRPFFGRIGSAKRHLTQQREEALRRSAYGPQQRDLRSRVAAKRAHFFEQQNQSRLLDDICQELLWLLRRHNRQPQSCRRRDYVELLQFQTSCVGMAQHKPACPPPGDGKTSPTGSQEQQLQAQADGTTIWPMAPDQTARPRQREFEFKGLRLVKDDGFWVQLESSDGRRQWAREQQGWPWVQPGLPLRYRLLELVHANSLHHRMEGGWQEHRWKEGRQATGESRAYFNQLTHAVTWRKPAALQFLPIIEPAATSHGAHGAKAAGQGGKPRPKAPSVGLLKPQSQSALTATLVDMLREPNPRNGQSVLAVAGFALLLVQGSMFAQALPALRRAVTLCLAEEDQEREKEHKAALAAQEDGSSEGEDDGDGAGKKKKPRMPSAASKAALLRAARQRAMLCLALSRLCLLTGDFRTAEQTARLTASKAASDAFVLCGVGDVLMHLCRRDEAEHVLLASLLLDPHSQPTFRAYARLCAARGQAEFADSYYRRAVAACNDTQALEKPNYREAAETCLEYACYLLEPWERKVPEAERLLRQALAWLTTRGQPQGFGLAYAPPPPERPDTDVDSHLMADICFALGRLYHLHRRDGSHATAYYRQACKLRPNFYAALLHHACLLATSRRVDDHRDADGLFRRALSLPEASTPHARLLPPLLYAHFLAATLGDTAQAESECVVAMASGSALAVPLVALSSMLSRLPHPTTATRMLCRRLNRRLSQLYPRDPVALVALGMTLLQETSEPTPASTGPLPALTELREEALACFDEALRLTNGRFAPALRGKGLLMSQGPDKDTTAALELFLQGLSVMPECVALLRTTAMHLLTHMPLLGAVCPAATSKAPQTRNNRTAKSGEDEELSGDYTEARHQVVAYLNRALSLEPNDASTLVTLALVTLRVQPHEAATVERLLHRGVQASLTAVDKGRCLRLLGHLAYDRGVNVQAAEAFHAALQVCPTDNVAAVGLAACLAASGDGVQVDKPEMQFQAAWANGPPASSYCHLMYGVFKLKMRYDRAAARDLFLFAARDKTRPPNCLALYYLGRIAMMGNKLKEMEKWMVFAIETEPLGFLQVVEWGFMVQELHKDYLAEKVLFEQARRRRKGVTSTIYKEKSVERFEALKRIMHYGRLRQQFLVEKRGLDVLAPDSADSNGGGSFRYTTTFMAEAGWEQRYASLYYGEAESWAALFTAQLACEQARLKANVDRSADYRRACSPTRALSAKRRPKSACASQHGLRNNGVSLHGAEGRGPKLGMVGELQMELLQARPSTAPAGGGSMSAGKRAALARGEGTLRGPVAMKNRPGSAMAYR